MSKKLLAMAALLSAMSAAPPALAGMACGQRDEIVSVLRDKYSEQHRASGLETASKMIEVWASEETGTWTILVTQANGMTCVAASGQNWLEYELTKVSNDTPS